MLRIRDVYPGFNFFPSRIRIRNTAQRYVFNGRSGVPLYRCSLCRRGRTEWTKGWKILSTGCLTGELRSLLKIKCLSVRLFLRYALFCRCFEHGQYRQALGIAIETKRIDVFERAVTGELTDVQV